MTIFKHRPLCIVGILFLTSAILGVSFSFKTQIALLVGSGIALVASIVLTLFLTRKAKTAILIFATLFCTILLMLFRIHLPVQEVKAFEKETETTVVCRITDIPYHNEDYYVCIVKTRVIGATARELPLALTFTSDFPYQIGDTLEARGVIISFEDRYRDYAYYISNGARGLLDAGQVSEPTRVSPNLLTYARRLQNGISNHFHSVYEERTASLLSAVMIADKSGLSPYTQYRFERTGLSHLLALSGLHVTILVSVLSALLSLLRLPKKASNLLLLLLIPAYACIAGLSASVVRAACMTCIALIGTFTRRERDSLTSLFFAASAILLVSPGSVFDVGYWLSVTATFGLLLVPKLPERYPFLKHFYFVWQFLLQPMLITLFATVLTLPAVAIVFGKFSLLFLPANLIFPLLMQWFMTLCIFTLLFPFLAFLQEWYYTAMMWLLGVFADIPGAVVSIRHPILIGCVCAITVLLILLCILTHKKKKPLAISLAASVGVFVLLLGIFSLISHFDNRMIYDSIGEGNERTVVHYSSKTLVCESHGKDSYAVSRLADVMADLDEHDVDAVYFVAYEDSIPQYLYLLFGEYYVGQLLLPAPMTDYERFMANGIEEMCRAAHVEITYLDPDTPYKVGGISLTQLPRNPAYLPDDDVYCGYTVRVDRTVMTYLTEGYSTTSYMRQMFAPTLLIYGQYGSDPILIERYRFTGEAEVILIPYSVKEIVGLGDTNKIPVERIRPYYEIRIS